MKRKKASYSINGKMLTCREVLAKYKIPLSEFIYRVYKLKLTAQQAVEMEINSNIKKKLDKQKRKKGRKKALHEVNGEMLSIGEMEKKYNISTHTLINRMYKLNVTAQQAVDMGKKLAIQLEINGEKLYFKQARKKYGVQKYIDANKIFQEYKNMKAGNKTNKEEIAAYIKELEQRCTGELPHKPKCVDFLLEFYS